MSVIIDGTAGITFPSGSGTQAAQSKVLQVVNATYGTQVSSTSGTYATTGLTASITPLFSTSKVAVFAMVSYQTLGNNTGLGLALYKGGSVLWNPSEAYSGGPYGAAYGSASALCGFIPLNYIDSPATTSSTTYAIYFASYNATGVRVQPSDTTNNGQSSIILMEIAA
jgi:hypothetical protein